MNEWLAEATDAEISMLANYLANVIDAPVKPEWSYEHALMFGILMLAFGLIVFAMMALLLLKRNSATAVLRICALPLIIVSAVYLIVVGYTETQIAPVLSLLSAIAGYLLGRQDSGSEPPPTKTNKPESSLPPPEERESSS